MLNELGSITSRCEKKINKSQICGYFRKYNINTENKKEIRGWGGDFEPKNGQNHLPSKIVARIFRRVENVDRMERVRSEDYFSVSFYFNHTNL